MNNTSNVRLPDVFWERAQNQDELKQLIMEYIKRNYPGYTIWKVKGRFAVCEINR